MHQSLRRVKLYIVAAESRSEMCSVERESSSEAAVTDTYTHTRARHTREHRHMQNTDIDMYNAHSNARHR